jgi:hypothetical protein
MRRVSITALATAAALTTAGIPTAAQADNGDLTLVATFSGNQCKTGDITTCYAPSLTQVGPHGAPVPGETPGILRTDFDSADGTGTMAGFSDWITTTTIGGDTHYILNFDYTGSEIATYIGVFQGGSGLDCAKCKNTYQLFHDPDGITAGSIDLTTYFTNDTQISHVDLFDHGGAVPEPATWALMLVGFGGVGAAMRRSRKRQAELMQIA